MESKKNLLDIISKQKIMLLELEKEIHILTNSDLSVENEKLRKDLENYKSNIGEYKEKTKALSEQNRELKTALHAQIYSEKIQLINKAQNKSNIYFKSSIENGINRLAHLERDVFSRLNSMLSELQKSGVDASAEIYNKLNMLSQEVAQTINLARENLLKQSEEFAKNSSESFDKLRTEEITEETITAIGKKNNLENLIGTNLINKLGIIFVILGMLAIPRANFIPDALKSIVMFLISGGFLALGEWLNRKEKTIFSLGITSVGVAGFYTSLAISYFGLSTISMYPAIIICILITIGAFLLSTRYNSQTIAVFAMVGGYLPIFSIANNTVLVYGAMVYFVMLNLLALSISLSKKWRVSMFIGYFLNLVGTIYIIDTIGSSTLFRIRIENTRDIIITIFYVFFTFAIYTLIPILSNLRKKLNFTTSDIIILAINTFFSAIIMYVVFHISRLSDYNGLITIIFAITYFGLGKFIKTYFESEKYTKALFYLTGLTFVILFIPFQFNREWLTLGWLIQGVSIATYGIWVGKKSFKTRGLAIFGLSVWTFVVIDTLWFNIFIYTSSNLYPYKYFAVTIGSLVILTAFALKKSFSTTFEKLYKYVVLFNTWFYGLYIVTILFHKAIYHNLPANLNKSFFGLTLWVIVTFFIAFILPNIPVIRDKGVKIISTIINIIGMLMTIILIGGNKAILRVPLQPDAPVTTSTYVIASIVLIVVSLLALLAMKNTLKFFVSENKALSEWVPFGLSMYFLLLLTQSLVVQYNISGTSIAISIIYIVSALLWIIYGFIKKFVFMRRFGLSLSILAIAKLFLIDLHGLAAEYRIISYFAFGITLLLISFVYQHFSKKLNTEI